MRLMALLAALAATPAAAATEYGFVSLRNTDFVVLLAFILFVAILLYYRVPSTVARMLDGRAAGIRSELSEARALRDEAQALMASFAAKRAEMDAQGRRIVDDARAEAERVATAARAEAARTVERRLASATDRLASAEAQAVKRVRDEAVTAAVAAAREVLTAQMTDADADRLVDQSIDTVGAKLH